MHTPQGFHTGLYCCFEWIITPASETLMPGFLRVIKVTGYPDFSVLLDRWPLKYNNVQHVSSDPPISG